MYQTPLCLCGKERVAQKEYCADYCLKELQESMGRCTDCHNITEILLKMALNTIQSISQQENVTQIMKLSFKRQKILCEKEKIQITNIFFHSEDIFFSPSVPRSLRLNGFGLELNVIYCGLSIFYEPKMADQICFLSSKTNIHV